MKKIKFNPGVRITIFFVFFAILFFSLGLWQIERGQSKENILKEFENNIMKSPTYLNKDSNKWDRVFVEGTWIGSKQIYIDNVIYGGMAGYKVLTPLKIKETNELILVDRGWIKQNEYRGNLPDISINEDSVTVTGILELPELGLVLSDRTSSISLPDEIIFSCNAFNFDCSSIVALCTLPKPRLSLINSINSVVIL